ncbi:MAG: HAMP domain-containing protein [Bryobacteraceae bacterium]|nr:HAMP domain-containing protein [Bryobacteraceae bacterium]
MPDKTSATPLPRFGIAVKLAVSLVSVVLLGFLFFGYFQLDLEQKHLETLVGLSADRVADVVHSSAYRAMLHNDRGALYTLIQDFGREPGIRRVRIVNEEGLIQHSTLGAEVGTLIDKSAEACYACHSSSKPLTKLHRKDRARIFRDEQGRRNLAVIRPIENAPECSNAACHAHPESRRILGVIDAHLALDAVDAQLEEHRLQMISFTAGAALLACVLSVMFVFRVVHKPVRLLLRAIERVKGGDLEHRLNAGSKDEFGVLATEFDAMAHEINAAQEELRRWNDTLEARVQQKSSELEKAHRGLVTNEKMASLGRLAATVAHEVNNPLFGMLTYARLCLKDLDQFEGDEARRERVKEHLRIIERESRRCGDLMKTLLAFSRQKAPERAPTEVNVIVERSCALLLHKLQLSRIELIKELDPGLPVILADPAQIQQVMVVLLANASEAIGEGGMVKVTTAALPDEQGVKITVTDSGPGVPAGLREAIFEPFFTTKEDQHGTGLGLAVARAIIDRHGGSLTLNPDASKGAEFIIQLPLEAPADLATSAADFSGGTAQ